MIFDNFQQLFGYKNSKTKPEKHLKKSENHHNAKTDLFLPETLFATKVIVMDQLVVPMFKIMSHMFVINLLCVNNQAKKSKLLL